MGDHISGVPRCLEMGHKHEKSSHLSACTIGAEVGPLARARTHAGAVGAEVGPLARARARCAANRRELSARAIGAEVGPLARAHTMCAANDREVSTGMDYVGSDITVQARLL